MNPWLPPIAPGKPPRSPAMNPRRSPLPAPAGFTLVELLAVIAILAVISGLVVLGVSGVQETAARAVADRQAAAVREALLRFRNDLGFYPGDGPLAPGQLDLSSIGGAPRSPAWAAHPMNFWMLFEKPVDRDNPRRWDWNPQNARGWRGPYLQLSDSARLDLDPALREMPGLESLPLESGLYAIGDLLGAGGRAPAGFRWRDPRLEPGDESSRSPKLGSPFLFERDPLSLPGWVLFRIHSPGGGAAYLRPGEAPGPDAIHLEIARRPLQP